MGRRIESTLWSVVLANFVIATILISTPRSVTAGVHTALVSDESSVMAGTEFEVQVNVVDINWCEI